MPTTANTFDPAAHPELAAVIGPADDGWPEGHEKHRTTRLDGLRYRGVWLASRWGKANDLATMQAALTYLHQAGAGIICDLLDDLFADSKAGSYSGRVRTPRQDVADAVADWLGRALLAVDGGHNGVLIEADRGVEAEASPDWIEAHDGGPA